MGNNEDLEARERAIAINRAVKVDKLANAFTTTTLRLAGEREVPIWGHEAGRMIASAARGVSREVWVKVAHDHGINEPSDVTIACVIAVLEARAGL